MEGERHRRREDHEEGGEPVRQDPHEEGEDAEGVRQPPHHALDGHEAQLRKQEGLGLENTGGLRRRGTQAGGISCVIFKEFHHEYIFQTLAIKFGNEANSQKFFEAFEEMRKYVLKMEAKKIQEEEAKTGSNVCPAAAEADGGDGEAKVADKMSELSVAETQAS